MVTMIARSGKRLDDLIVTVTEEDDTIFIVGINDIKFAIKGSLSGDMYSLERFIDRVIYNLIMEN